MCMYNHTWYVTFLTGQSISTLVIVFIDVLVKSLCSMVKKKTAPCTTHPLLLFPLVQQIPEVWAELDHTLGGGGFVD